MPWILYRHITKELLRLLVVSATVLVLLISFAAALRPLTEGLLGPWTLLKYVLYSAPTTLALVMPFAGAFASTMVFNRMAGDNEIVACAASGMSYRALLLPVFALGWVLTVGLLLVSSWLVPLFFQKTTAMLERDLVSVVVRQVQAGRPVKIPGRDGYVLFANDAQLAPDFPASEDLPRVMLRGVAVGRFDSDHQLRDLHVAEQADIYIRHRDGQTMASLRLANLMSFDPATGTYGGARKTDTLPIELETPRKHNLKFYSWPELKRLRERPERYDRIWRRKHRLAAAMSQSWIVGRIESALAAPASEVTLDGTDGPVVISAPKSSRVGSVLELHADGTTPVRVRRRSRDRIIDVEAESAVVSASADRQDDEPRLTLDLERVAIADQPLKKELSFSGLAWPEPVLQSLMALSPQELRQRVTDGMADEVAVHKAFNALIASIEKLNRKIFAQVNERSALSVASLLVMVLGALLSMKMRGTMPLVVYLVSFLLASIAVFITRSGENVASDPEYHVVAGAFTVYLGDLMLAGVIVFIYMRLARN